MEHRRLLPEIDADEVVAQGLGKLGNDRRHDIGDGALAGDGDPRAVERGEPCQFRRRTRGRADDLLCRHVVLVPITHPCAPDAARCNTHSLDKTILRSIL